MTIGGRRVGCGGRPAWLASELGPGLEALVLHCVELLLERVELPGEHVELGGEQAILLDAVLVQLLHDRAYHVEVALDAPEVPHAGLDIDERLLEILDELVDLLLHGGDPERVDAALDRQLDVVLRGEHLLDLRLRDEDLLGGLEAFDALIVLVALLHQLVLEVGDPLLIGRVLALEGEDALVDIAELDDHILMHLLHGAMRRRYLRRTHSCVIEHAPLRRARAGRACRPRARRDVAWLRVMLKRHGARGN